MALLKIQLTSKVLIDGKVASPEDENKGVYELDKFIALNLIFRKRAVKFGEAVKVEKPEEKGEAILNLDELKYLATMLEIKFNPSIGAPKLNAKILAELQPKAEELKIEINEENALKVYDLIKAAENNGQDANGTIEEISEEELRAIAAEAEIELPYNLDTMQVKEMVKAELEDYASELKLEVAENETVKEIWAKIQEKLKENDN